MNVKGRVARLEVAATGTGPQQESEREPTELERRVRRVFMALVNHTELGLMIEYQKAEDPGPEMLPDAVWAKMQAANEEVQARMAAGLEEIPQGELTERNDRVMLEEKRAGTVKAMAVRETYARKSPLEMARRQRAGTETHAQGQELMTLDERLDRLAKAERPEREEGAFAHNFRALSEFMAAATDDELTELVAR